jgi:hypothetical protein
VKEEREGGATVRGFREGEGRTRREENKEPQVISKPFSPLLKR